MKTKIISTTIALAGILILFNACESTLNRISPSDRISTQQHSFSDYDRIETESAFSVYVTFSDTEEKIEIEANDNLHQYIDVREESGSLKIRFRNNYQITGSATLNAYITTRNVSGFHASGASRFIVNDEILSNNVAIFLSGASKFTGEIYADHLQADLSGASLLQLEGDSETSDIMASGASHIENYQFQTDHLNLSLSGASSAALTVNEKLDVMASGASVLRYKGTAVVNSQNISGGSQLIKMD